MLKLALDISMFNLFDYGAVMKKKLYLSFMLISMVLPKTSTAKHIA